MEAFKENDVDSRLVKKTICYIEGQELIKAKKPSKTHGNLDKGRKRRDIQQPAPPIRLRGRRFVGTANSHEEEGREEDRITVESLKEDSFLHPFGNHPSESKEDMQHNELTPDAVLRDLTASLKSSVFSIEQQAVEIASRATV